MTLSVGMVIGAAPASASAPYNASSTLKPPKEHARAVERHRLGFMSLSRSSLHRRRHDAVALLRATRRQIQEKTTTSSSSSSTACGKERDLAGLHVVCDAFDVFERAVILPDLSGFFREAL